MTETELPLKFVTYTRVPAGCTATPKGQLPTDTVAVTALVAVSMTDTELLNCRRGSDGTKPASHREGVILFWPEACAAEVARVKNSPNLYGYYVLDDSPGDAVSEHLAGTIAGLAVGMQLPEAHELGALTAAMSVSSPHTINKKVTQDTLREFAGGTGAVLSDAVAGFLEVVFKGVQPHDSAVSLKPRELLFRELADGDPELGAQIIDGA